MLGLNKTWYSDQRIEMVGGLGNGALCTACPASIKTYTVYNKLRESKEASVLFNDVVDTFYLRLYRCTHMVKDHSDSEGYSFRLAARVRLYPTDRITHTTTFVTPVVEHWLERAIAQWVHHEGLIRRPIIP